MQNKEVEYIKSEDIDINIVFVDEGEGYFWISSDGEEDVLYNQ